MLAKSLVVSAVDRSSINFNDAKNVHTGRQYFQIVYSSLRDTEEGERQHLREESVTKAEVYLTDRLTDCERLAWLVKGSLIQQVDGTLSTAFTHALSLNVCFALDGVECYLPEN